LKKSILFAHPLVSEGPTALAVWRCSDTGFAYLLGLEGPTVEHGTVDTAVLFAYPLGLEGPTAYRQLLASANMFAYPLGLEGLTESLIAPFTAMSPPLSRRLKEAIRSFQLPPMLHFPLDLEGLQHPRKYLAKLRRLLIPSV